MIYKHTQVVYFSSFLVKGIHYQKCLVTSDLEVIAAPPSGSLLKKQPHPGSIPDSTWSHLWKDKSLPRVLPDSAAPQ